MTKPFLVSLALVTVCAPSTALADAGPKIEDSLWFPLGINTGYAINPAPLSNGFLIGPEASFVYLDHSATWAGVYTDVLRDFGAETTRWSVGAEFGVAIFGLDVGYVRSYGDVDWGGLRGRLLLSLAAIHLYGGPGWILSGEETEAYGEIGLLLKFPINIWSAEPRRRHYPAVDREEYERPPQNDEQLGEAPLVTEPGPEPPPPTSYPPPGAPLVPKPTPDPTPAPE